MPCSIQGNTSATTFQFLMRESTIFGLCQQKKVHLELEAVVFGFPTRTTGNRRGKVKAVANMLPGSELLVGEKATAEALRARGPFCWTSAHRHACTIVRITRCFPHSLRRWLPLPYDLYQMRIPARLVTLSGARTGMNWSQRATNLLGLQRGLFLRGRSTLLLSLWDVSRRKRRPS